MDNRKYVISQAVTVLIGELILSALMVAVFAVLGYFDRSVLFGAAAGAVAVMMLPKQSAARKLIDKAAVAVENAASNVGDKLMNKMDM